MCDVVVIDDDEAVLTLIEHLLRVKHRVHAFSSSVDADAAIPEINPEVVISDLMMPEMRGDEIIRRIQDDTTQCIILTGHAEAPLDDYVDSGALWVLQKPEGLDRLISRVDRACSFARGLRKLRKSGKISKEMKVAAESLLLDLDDMIGSMQNVPARKKALVTG